MTSINHWPLCITTNTFIGSGGLNHSRHIDSIRNRRLSVLLIDDTEEFRESMTFVLTEKYDAIVTDVSSGREAVNLLEAGHVFNVIFLDLIMPEMNGVETYLELRRVGAACRVLVMSAHPDSEEWKEAENVGVELIEKPIEEDVLTTVLSEL